MARSRELYGPYEPNPSNPILTNANTTEYFQAVGHADLFQDARGQWWGVALAVRSGSEWETFPMGRETVLYNVTWETNSWPKLQHPVRGEMRGWSLPGIVDTPGDGPFVDSGDTNITFNPNTTIPPHFVYWRPPILENYAISPSGHPNSLRLTPSSLNLTGVDGNSPGPGGQTFISRRQVDTLFTFTFDLDYHPTTLNEEAGITLFLTQNHHARLGISLLPIAINSTILAPHFHFHAISYIPVPKDIIVAVPEHWLNKTLTLSLRAVNTTHYAFGAGLADGSVEVQDLAVVGGDVVSWGFTGALLGAYATGNGGEGRTLAYVMNWNYRGWGQVRGEWDGVGV
ncbi:hypothetical protein NX059_007698 [Plenodomus lindquistii]|nr:hypothetical protein NX059_007698 [Plenodomus lindquistii]